MLVCVCACVCDYLVYLDAVIACGTFSWLRRSWSAKLFWLRGSERTKQQSRNPNDVIHLIRFASIKKKINELISFFMTFIVRKMLRFNLDLVRFEVHFCSLELLICISSDVIRQRKTIAAGYTNNCTHTHTHSHSHSLKKYAYLMFCLAWKQKFCFCKFYLLVHREKWLLTCVNT